MRHTPVISLLAAIGLCFAIAGCKKEETGGTNPATPAATVAGTPAGATAKETYKGVTFDRPAGWKVTKSTDPEGIQVEPPDEQDQDQAFAFLEFNTNAAEQSLPALMEQSASDLYGSKANFSLKSKDILPHPGGFDYGKIVFTSTAPGGVPLTQARLIVPVGKEGKLFVLTSATTGTIDKYQPVFEKLAGSIRVEKK